MRQIEIGDINRTLLMSVTLPDGEKLHPSTEFIKAGLRLELKEDGQNYIISQLMGYLSYRKRQPLVRVLDRIKLRGGGKFDIFDLWATFGAQFLERRHTLFVRPMMFEQWRRDFHSLDEDLPGITFLAREDDEMAPDARRAFTHFQHWHTFTTGDDQQLSQEIAKGIAIQHLHLAGSYPAPYFWVGLMNMRFDGETIFEQSEKGRANRYQSRLGPVMLRAYVRRAVALRHVLFKFADALLSEEDEHSRKRLIQELSVLTTAEVHEQFISERRKKAIVDDRGSDTDYAQRLCALADNSPQVNMATCPSLLGERMLLYTVIHYIARGRKRQGNDPELDHTVARALWAYLQAKNLFLGTAQQSEGIAGFDFFEWTLRHISWMRTAAERKACAQEIGRFLQESRSVVKMEFMASPPKEMVEYRETFEILREIRNVMTEQLSPSLKAHHGGVRVGLIMHFIKKEGEDLRDRLTGDQAAYKIYHCGVRDTIHERSAKLLKYLESKRYENDRKASQDDTPSSRIEICGIDTANRELHCPPEVFGPIYEKFSRLRIGRTYHVGEDFLHLMTGLRRIYEAIMYLGLRAGDRLGHCIALGVSPKLWVHANPTVSMHRIDMLDDAVFEWTLLQEYGLADPLRLTQLERLIARHSMDIFGAPLDPNVLQTSWKMRGADFLDKCEKFTSDDNVPPWIRRQGLIMAEVEKIGGATPRVGTHNVIPSISELDAVAAAYRVAGQPVSPQDWPRDDAERVLLEYLYDRHTIHREIQMEPISTLADLPHITRVQDILREAVKSMGLTVESNPSSNWLIGGFERLYDVPAVQWALKHPTFPMTINPDDPVTFSTSIENEFFFVFSCLLRGTDELPGLSRLEALERIRRIRQHGLESSFLQ